MEQAFSDLAARQLFDLIAPYGHQCSCGQRETIYREGDSPPGFYYLQSGLVSLHKLSASGKQRLLRIYSENSFFGYRSLITRERYHGSAIALKPCMVLVFPFGHIEELQQKVPDVFRYLATFLCGELKDAELRIFRNTSATMKQRVLDALAYLHQHHGHYPWTYREVGEFCGGETETVIRICNQLKKAGVLKKESRHWKVVDEQKLLELKDSQ